MSSQEKVELSAYQLKDVAHVWEQMRDERPIREGQITWRTFKTTFLDRFFPFGTKGEENARINQLTKGGVSVKKYSLNFT